MEDKDSHNLLDTYDWVIYLADDWEHFWKRHLIRELARQLPNSRILCVARPMCLFTGSFRYVKRFLAWLKQIKQITILDKNLMHFCPSILLHDHLAVHVPLVRQLNKYWLRYQLHLAVMQSGLRRRRLIILIYDPFQLDYLNVVEKTLSIYDIHDGDITGQETPFLRTKTMLLKKEQAILEKVDIVFTISEMVEQRIKRVHSNVHVVSSAVDPYHFGRAADHTEKPAPDVAEIQHPIVGYLGNVTSRIDFGLITHLAMLHPDWSIVLIGGVTEQGFSIPKSLAKLTNVYCLGARPYESLPNYIRVFDVSIIPYMADNPWNVNCSPLKLYEYLATGKPIVSTDLPSVRPFDGLVRIARTTDEFERQVAAALEERDAALRHRRLAAARENSWDNQAKAILGIIDVLLKERLL